jgi:uncharacterized RDD family membrane protein YckC
MVTAETIGACANCDAGIRRDYEYASCPACGEQLSVEINRRLRNPSSRRLLEERGILPYDDAVEPVDVAAATPAGPDPRVAGPLIRAAARGIDVFAGVLISIPATIAAFLLLVLLGTPGGIDQWAPRMQELSAVMFVFSFVGSALYYTVSEWIGGATLGKLACGLRVLSEDFGPPTLRGTFIRAMAFVLDGLFFGMVALHAMQQSKLRQRCGDKWGRTIVVKHREVPGSDRGWPRVILGTAIGCGLWAAAQTYSLVSQVIAVR